jgi:hypothetical protein
MPRKSLDEEIAIREKMEELIEREALQTDGLVFYPPLYVVAMLEDFGHRVSKDYVIKFYRRKGVQNRNGLWVKKI